MFQAFGLMAGLLTVVSYIPYTRDILKRRAAPERASWFIWGLAATIALLSQHAEGASQSLWFPGLDALGCYFTFVLALKFGVGGFLKRDVISLMVLGVALIIWGFTNNAVYALIMTIATDAAGALLTIWKLFDQPYSETYPMWLIVWLASLIAVLSVGKLDVWQLIFPIYMFIATGAIVGAIFYARKYASKYLIPDIASMPLSTNGDHPGPSMLGFPYWSHDPVQVGSVATLNVPIEYSAASVVGGEYVGVRDPGPGKGTAMAVVDGHLKVDVIASFVGVHPINIRAKDTNGVWSEFSSIVLTVLPVPLSPPRVRLSKIPLDRVVSSSTLS